MPMLRRNGPVLGEFRPFQDKAVEGKKMLNPVVTGPDSAMRGQAESRYPCPVLGQSLATNADLTLSSDCLDRGLQTIFSSITSYRDSVMFVFDDASVIQFSQTATDRLWGES